jgi:hypothetical protein
MEIERLQKGIHLQVNALALSHYRRMRRPSATLGSRRFSAGTGLLSGTSVANQAGISPKHCRQKPRSICKFRLLIDPGFREH